MLRKGFNMKNFKILTVLIMMILASTLVTGYAEDTIKSEEYSYVDRMFGYAAELYVDEELTKEEILYKALDKYLEENPDAVYDILRAGFSNIDDYSEFYTAKEYSDYLNNVNHTVYGIGVMIQKQGEYIQIISVTEDGSAKAAGIIEGDYIFKVNGESMKGKSIDEVQQKVVGELNTMVSVTILRDDVEYTYDLVRRPVSGTTVDYIKIDDNVAYVSVVNFAMSTAEEFRDLLSELDTQGITKIILDLRNNPGGYLQSAVDIAKMIVPKGVIVKTMYRQSENNETFYSDLENPKYEFMVLVNENTASAAEILTGAIQDSKVGKVIGTTTYGKAVIQEIYNLRDSNAFKITTGRYLTRNGREINNKGLEPDFEVINITETVDPSEYEEIDFLDESSFGDKEDNIIRIKERMRILGYLISNPDNYFDEELEASVLDFQIKNRIKPTGKLDKNTLNVIEVRFKDAEVLVDSQLYKAYELFGGTREQIDSVIKSK